MTYVKNTIFHKLKKKQKKNKKKHPVYEGKNELWKKWLLVRGTLIETI